MNISEIKNVVVVGSGIMGIGIAQNFAQAGLSVHVVDQDKNILDKSLTQIDANVKLFKEYDLLDEDPSAITARIKPVLNENLDEVLKECDFIIEAIPEKLELKKDLFNQLDSLSTDVIIASNTSSFTITNLAEDMKTPERVIGLHYFNPAHIIPAVEIHRGNKTSDEVVELTRDLMIKVGKKPALVRKVLPGFIINRLTGALYREVNYLIDQGITTPEDLDTAVKGSFGFRLSCLGPMEAEDMIGLDTSATVSGRVFGGLSNATDASPTLKAKVEKGELGIKSGKGWYDYTGKSQIEIADQINRKLLGQLAVFNSGNKQEKEEFHE
ncbi:MAG: 3-hydroxyacyl-CoA dehydrogenase family protein [Deltaproteobacteria bacterium]|nr:3-hydroxyacyl-CoA dehydrogenase family protein [Deltaproteobacteria bacterium]